MLSPALSLYPGHQQWDGAGAGGDQRPSYGRTLALLAVVVLLTLLAVLLYLLLRPDTAQHAAVGPPSSAPEPGTDALDLPPPPAAGQPRAGSRPAAGGMAAPPLQLTGAAALTEQLEHDGGLLLVRMAHHAEGPFSVALSGQPGRDAAAGGSVAEVTGIYRGTRAVVLPAGRYTVDVEGAGWWGVTLERPRYDSGVRLPHTIAGVGDTASEPFQVPAPRTVRMRWKVESDGTAASRPADLNVRVLDAAGDVVARFDAREGTETQVDLDAGVYLLDVATSAGVWRVSLG